ncbi:hypothetical protein ADK67_16465 [Saccharothrix sp. NRRL B-16348]|uniref:TetR/AcrR family transcriptional regulator n=1 Tax=Saccharothrix sp. NRRL B-16348 TaxID=1415542 RepID=UPI0006AE5DCC|nr:TetR/AcrR family transcriptional regulator [Saccharothrix sp. NRRL B-16348]KOX25941.1 hypothetical protein ADK67_16465 [Saccharothrix sp. NRRL B-16348]
MSRPAVYQHFKNKEEVFRAVGERLVAELVEAATGTALEPSSSDEQARRLRRLVDLVAVGLTDRSPRRSDGLVVAVSGP